MTQKRIQKSEEAKENLMHVNASLYLDDMLFSKISKDKIISSKTPSFENVCFS